MRKFCRLGLEGEAKKSATIILKFSNSTASTKTAYFLPQMHIVDTCTCTGFYRKYFGTLCE